MRYAVLLVVFEVVLGLLLFGSAGRLDLPWVWALLACHTVAMAAGLAAMEPDLLRERTRRRCGGIDRLFRSLMLVTILTHLLVAGLDVGRFHWSPELPAAAASAALLVYVAGVAIAMRAMVVNRFFAPAVRIQAERGHYPVTTGPYRFVRHPGYAGMLLALVAECVVLGSLWSAAPLVLFAATLFTRTAMEDRMLCDGLSGYAEYAAAVRYRLVPLVW